MDKRIEEVQDCLELVVRLELRIKANEYEFNRVDVKDAVSMGLEQHLLGMDGYEVRDLDEAAAIAAIEMENFNTIMATLENELEPVVC